MSFHQAGAIAVTIFLCIYLAVELGWRGGRPTHKDHNRLPWRMW